ncbi:MAG: phosphatase PAP2 family protein [Candidatus Cohnella colombiensis]|uniref:Phosphatase PAP2 family protein n=1 Tax=Candidatus Cohnella colombiensis TaxID=3121368 RepID=A0AA95EYR0_9BACL|nr:MAG: phosphatase PAP2 family protein [Cohnella sp.]
MTLFHSMTSVTIYTLVSVILLISFGAGRQPFTVIWGFVRTLLTSRNVLFFFIGMLMILLLNKHELKLEEWIEAHYDLTSMIVGWEGSWQAWLQDAVQTPFVTQVSAFFYVVIFQSVLIASIGIYAYQRNVKLIYAFSIALLLNYLIALPFYVFVPVNEAWFANPQIKFLMLDAFPSFEKHYRELSGINNCFPSLHTSISLTMALLASQSGIRRWKIFVWISAVIIIFSIFYLGIHWFTDMVAGVILAIVATKIGLAVGTKLEQRLPDVNWLARFKSKNRASRTMDS